MNVVDDLILTGPERTSKQVGRAQAVMAFASEDDVAVLMAINLAFTEGKYNGSTVTVLGRNMVFTELREMPVAGGTGVFRFATGYVKTSTHTPWILKPGSSYSNTLFMCSTTEISLEDVFHGLCCVHWCVFSQRAVQQCIKRDRVT